MPRPNPFAETLYTIIGLGALVARFILWGVHLALWFFAAWLAVMVAWFLSLFIPAP